MRDEEAPMRDRLQRGTLHRRTLLAGGGAATLGLAAPAVARAEAARKLTFVIHYLPRGDYAPYYLARERGYYAAQGIDLTIQHVVGNALAYQALASGGAQVAHADMTQMLQLHGTQPGLDLVSVGVAIDRCPMSLFYRAGRGIRTPKDLEGRTIVDSAGSNAQPLFKLFCAANGVDGSKVTWMIAAASAKVALMLEGQADFVATDYQAKAGIDAKLPSGQTIDAFVFGEHGVNLVGDGLITTGKLISSERKTIAGFMQATLKGFHAANADPKAAVAAIARHFPELDPKVALGEMALWQALVTGPDQQPHGMGWHNPETMQANYDAAETISGSKLPKPVAAYYTNDFIG